MRKESARQKEGSARDARPRGGPGGKTGHARPAGLTPKVRVLAAAWGQVRAPRALLEAAGGDVEVAGGDDAVPCAA